MAADERQNRRVLHGALLIAALLASAVLIFMLDDLVDMFRRDYAVVAVVSDAAGITDGSAVWIAGKEVGTVTTVAFLPSGPDTTARIALTLELPRRLQAQVRRDSPVRVTSATLIGARVVDILPGSATAPAAAPGDTLRQRKRLSADEVTARAAAVRAGLDSVMAELRPLAAPASARIADTQRALAAVELAMAEATRLQADIAAGPAAALLADTAFTAALDRVRSHADALPLLIEQVQVRSAATGEVRAALARLQARAAALSAALDAATAQAGPNSSLARFQQDTALSRALTAARAELDSLLAEVRRNPLRFVF
jgi:phospholipid/cholesterol/gamma-HCH transport system substrate-binding protein